MSNSDLTIVGTVGRDPELKFTGSGRAVASFPAAVAHRYRSGNDWKEETSWITVVAWGDLAENVAASISKGMRVVATGRLQIRQFESNGEKRTATELVADDVGPSLRFATATVDHVSRTRRQVDDEDPF